jgi:hypothetical protein
VRPEKPDAHRDDGSGGPVERPAPFRPT